MDYDLALKSEITLLIRDVITVAPLMSPEQALEITLKITTRLLEVFKLGHKHGAEVTTEAIMASVPSLAEKIVKMLGDRSEQGSSTDSSLSVGGDVGPDGPLSPAVSPNS